ncbi:hypothetical protein P691DRAFT_736981 [Macrolepiota fuliginosa MF-IS2]|uniref:Ribosomal protein S15 n=1 Tax=Macrolepiota fuliginosa MF-IS2 TaxID=1400762 RepID=A0A9P5X5Q1_9AGAR|nr:hypothetical protein P691DRAFT_736981 [Macrolepiota fuliginosa MF-IS2]
MFRTCLSQASSSASTRLTVPSSSSFHTAAILHAVRRQGQSVKKLNIQRTHERQAKEAENRPSVVLGTRAHEEAELWSKSDLAKCLVNPHNLNGPPATSPSSPSASSAASPTSSANASLTETLEISELGTTVQVPRDANYGIGQVEKEILFEELPVLSAQAPFLAPTSHFNSVFDSKVSPPSAEVLKQRQTDAVKKETAKLDAFSRVIDLQNANAKGIAYENRRRIVLEFSAPANPFDPGRAEVQAALLTYQIRNLWSHLTTFKSDVGNRRGLLKLIHQRAKILRYLKSKDQDRYEAVLPRLALEPSSIEGELVI